MNALVIYDNTGFIIFQATGTVREPQGGVQFMMVEVPDGKILSSIDTSVTPHEAVFADKPQTTEEKITDLQQSIAELSILLATS